jgi:hypothetical protein
MTEGKKKRAEIAMGVLIEQKPHTTADFAWVDTPVDLGRRVRVTFSVA